VFSAGYLEYRAMKLERVAQEWANMKAMSAARRHSSLRRESATNYRAKAPEPLRALAAGRLLCRKASKVARTGACCGNES